VKPNTIISGSADPSTLSPNPWNTNVVSPDNEAKLEGSIKRFGMFKPVIVRELEDGTLQIIGGEHRAVIAERLGIKKVPIVNLGRIDDDKAKEIGIVDNGRYGTDDTLQLAELLGGLTNAEELSTFMPYTDSDLASIFSSVNIALDELDLPDEDETPKLPKEKPIQTHQVMRFKVPVDDVAMLTEMIERVMKHQKFTEEDSLSNAGNALVYICNHAEV
jgi:ParB-like chromosome segregation protein Spo0J